MAFNADNASNNDKMTLKLAQLDNAFQVRNRVRCFNHTLQLAAKALLKPFHSCIGKSTTLSDDGDVAQAPDGNSSGSDDDEAPSRLDYDDDSSFEEDIDKEEFGDRVDSDDPDDGIDELEELGPDTQVEFANDTKVVGETIDKVCIHFFCLYLLIYSSLGSSDCLRHYSFDHHSPPCVAFSLH